MWTTSKVFTALFQFQVNKSGDNLAAAAAAAAAASAAATQLPQQLLLQLLLPLLPPQPPRRCSYCGYLQLPMQPMLKRCNFSVRCS